MGKEKVNSWWKILIEKFKKIISPEYSCYICGRELEHPECPICENCEKDMVEIEGNKCLVCGEPIPEPNLYCEDCYGKSRAFDMARSCYIYNDASKKIVLDLKYNRRKYVVPFMAKKMLLKFEDFGAMPDIVVPVPITEKRYKNRGFNQAELLADELASLTGNQFEVKTDLVLRVVDRVPQARLNRAERMRNLKGAFMLGSKEKLTGKIVMIVDDVFTTGSTVSEIANELRKLKPKAILALTFAKTPRNSY